MKLTSLGRLMVSLFVHYNFYVRISLLQLFSFFLSSYVWYFEISFCHFLDSSDSDVFQHKLPVFHEWFSDFRRNLRNKISFFINKTSGFLSSSISIRRFKIMWHHLRISQQIAGETLEIPLESQSYYLLVFYSLNVYVWYL